MAKIKTKVTVNGIDISTTYFRKWKVSESISDEVPDGYITVSRNIYDAIPTLDSGMPVTIQRGETTSTDQWVMRGIVDRVDKQGGNYIIYCRSKLGLLINKSVTKVFDGVAFPSTEAKGSDIATTLIETYGGMTASVVDTGTTVTLKRFPCLGIDVFSRLRKLAEIFNYQIRYDDDADIVYFEPLGNSTNANIIYVGGPNSNVNGLPKWVFDGTQIINKLIVKGAVQEVQEIETFDGDGSVSQVFQLTYTPISVQFQEDVGGNLILKVPGVVDSTTSFDYTIDKEQKSITTTDSYGPASGSDNVIFTYTRAIPVPIQVSDATSITSYGEHQAEKYFSDIRDVADAERRANAFVGAYKDPFTTVKCKVLGTTSYKAGEMVRITDTIHDEDRSLVITSIVKEYPHKNDEVNLGDEEYKLAELENFMIERVRRLEEQLQGDQQLLVTVTNFSRTITIERRYFDVSKRTIVPGQGFILGHPTEGILGTNSLGNPFDSDEDNAALQRRVWYQDTVVEMFIDEDFKGSGTANWNLSTNRLEF